MNETSDGAVPFDQSLEARLTSTAPSPVPAIVPVTSVAPFNADLKDGIFAIAAFILGYFYCRWVLASAVGLGVAVFTIVYLTTVLLYLFSKGIRPAAESWFFFAATLGTGLSFALWDNIGLMPLRNMFLFCSAVYWVISATTTQLLGKTSNFLFLDGINATIIIPFRNFINQYRALAVFKNNKIRDKKKVLSIVLGIALSLITLMIVTPQLIRADSGGFSKLIQGFINLFNFDWSGIGEFLFYCFLAVPTAAYLFGLISGSAAKRATGTFQRDKTEKAVDAARIAPSVTIYTVLGTVSALYIVFIVCQIPYFFSAFSGCRPEGWLSYSDYARQGFFELCGLSALNLAMLTASNILSKKPRVVNTMLKIFNITISLITLLFIATALSKMDLYIDTFGLTMLRILPCVFMVFLAIVCIAVIVLQKFRFSIVRFALFVGVVLISVFSLTNADGIVVRYNTDRYLAGTLSDYDTDILYRSGSAGIIPALVIYETTSDDVLKHEIGIYLRLLNDRLAFYEGTFRDTLQNAWARESLRDLDLS